MKKEKVLIVFLLLSLVLVAGCTSTSSSSSLKSDEEASEAVTDVAQNVDELGTTLEDITSDLGSSG